MCATILVVRAGAGAGARKDAAEADVATRETKDLETDDHAVETMPLFRPRT
jgi:hypothetical protein